MKLAFSTLACPDWTWPQLLEAARAFGYAGVEIRFLAGSCDLLRAEPFLPENHQRSRSDLDRYGIEIACLASSVRFDDLDPAKLQEQLEMGRAYLDLCHRLRIPSLRVFGDAFPDPRLREPTIAQVAAGLQTLGAYAQPRGVQVLIETHGDFSDSRTLQATLERVRSPAVGVLWDTHHPWRFYGELPEETFPRIGRWVRHTHWKDSLAQARQEPTSDASVQAAAEAHRLMRGHRHANYVLFGQGEFPACAVLNLLQSTGYQGWYCLEWEKKWHPELENPEIALPQFPVKIRALSHALTAMRSP